MKLRLKFLNKFHVFETAAASDTLNEIFESASKIFGLKRENVQISLNAKDYYNINHSNQSISNLGIVNGDIIYIRSLEKLDDIKQSLEMELTTPIFRLINHITNFQPYSSIYLMAIPLYIFATDKGLYNLDDINQYYQQRSSIIRLTFNYPQVHSIKVIFTLFQNGNMTCIAASVEDHPIRKQLILQTKIYLIKQDAICQSTVNKLNLLYRNLRLLAIRIKDKLIEPILLAIHSGEILCYLPLTSLGSLMFCNRELYCRIRNCNTIWRIQLAKLNAKKRLILDDVHSRQQSSSSLQQVDQEQTTLHKSQQKNMIEFNIIDDDITNEKGKFDSYI
ncbi:hypothetical protein Smp_128070 [Schistosoma mansoni]|uniref:hypothetical protein n=1 Tax=Schistosoma mansoni TaxID=6183 RepID=UPI00022C8775|nr:hypothetical protein Smp_128070 [Schistosoma mansoni]|eukprot:XP_018646274.1 hypothetical protein Smp_128070 [Schistosoma mansoni]